MSALAIKEVENWSLPARKAGSTANTLASKVPSELRRSDCRVNDKRIAYSSGQYKVPVTYPYYGRSTLQA